MEQTRRGLRSSVIAGTAVTLLAAVYFGYDLAGEPHFTDESAYVHHTYYYRLWIDGDWNHPDWLHFAAYDSPPVFKFLMGASLQFHGLQVPTTIRPAEMWYQRGSPAGPRLVRAARLPMYMGAVLGVAAIYCLGVQLSGIAAGVISSLLLATSPLYFTHARRAMGDDLTLALTMLGFVFLIASLRQLENNRRGRGAAYSAACGVCLGLAAAVKLSALAAPIVVAAVCLMTAVQTWRSRSAAAAIGDMTASLAPSLAMTGIVFIGINPYFWSSPTLPEPSADGRPVVITGVPRTRMGLDDLRRLAGLNVFGRFRNLLNYRLEALKESKRLFPEDVLETTPDRLRAIVVQGMGRWTAGGKEPITRTDIAPGQTLRHAGVTTTIPPEYWWPVPLSLSCIGAAVLGGQLYRQGRSGAALIAAVPLVWACVDVVMLSRNLTLDWDRYYLGVVCWSALLEGVGLAWLLRR